MRESTTVDGEKSSRKPELLMVQSVAKAFRVLEAFGGERSSMSLSQIAQQTGLDLSATQRFTHTLVSLGYLRRDPDSRQFELGLKVVDLSYNYTRASGLIERAAPILLHLSNDSDETVNLTVRDGTEVVFVSRYASRHVLNADVILGTRLPAYCTASGRAMLSRLGDDELDAVLSASAFKPFTPATPAGATQVRELVRQASHDGYAMAFEEYFLGDASIGAPVMGRDGLVAGAVNIGASTSRYTRAAFEERYGPMIVAAARSISWP